MKNTTKKREDYNDNHTFNTSKYSVMRPMIVSNNKLNVANKLNTVQQKKVVVMALYYLGLSSLCICNTMGTGIYESKIRVHYAGEFKLLYYSVSSKINEQPEHSPEMLLL